MFCDGPKLNATQDEARRIKAVREIVRRRNWCRSVTVVERDTNIGLAESIKGGIDWILERNDRVVVLEDDICVSPGFLEYMNAALSEYADDDRVMHISAYLPRTSYAWTLPQTFFARHMSCWGWGTWRRAWKAARWDGAALLRELEDSAGGRAEFDLDGAADFSTQLERNLSGELRTWAIFWAISIYLSDGLCLFPRSSLVENIGTDGTGENFRGGRTTVYDVSVAEQIGIKPRAVSESRAGRAYLRSFYRYGNDSGLIKRTKLSLGRVKHRIAMALQ